jgi:hypothetical protein
MTAAQIAFVHQSWGRHAIPITRACDHCKKSVGEPGNRVCGDPSAYGTSPQEARSLTGPCGPEARLMEFR